MTHFAASAFIDSGIRGTIRTQSRDEEAANGLRDVVRGFLALAKMQTSSRPEFADLLQTSTTRCTGETVSLSFDLPATAIDALSALGPPAIPHDLNSNRFRHRDIERPGLVSQGRPGLFHIVTSHSCRPSLPRHFTLSKRML
ncbi:MAG: hypothetical protein QM736_21265 [Vicinamibacterales bacterium]